jgi:hypothetical protein
MHSEHDLFRAFVVPSKRQRYSELLRNKRGRHKIRFDLDHFKDLDPRVCQKLKPDEQNATDILKILKGLGAPGVCYLISSDPRWDGREMNLSDALREVIGGGQGTFISCISGQLAYFEGEERNERYVCHRKARPGSNAD